MTVIYFSGFGTYDVRIYSYFLPRLCLFMNDYIRWQENLQTLSSGVEVTLSPRFITLRILLLVMKLLTESSGQGRDSADCCRRRKWAGVRLLYNIINQKAYRYHSITCALETTPGITCTVSRTAFVSRLMAEYQFDRTLRMDTKLSSIYDYFEGAKDDAIDYRDVLCCMVLLRQYRKIREDPHTLFRNLVLLFSDEPGTKVLRRDALRVARMGALHKGEILQTSTRLDNYLAEEAGSRGLKPNFIILDVTFLMEVIESYPSVLTAFRTQLWHHVPKSWRMGLMRAMEAMASSSALAIKLHRAARWYATKLSRWIIVGWKIFTNRSKAVRAQRVAIERVTQRHAIRGWYHNVSREAIHRKNRTVASKRQRLTTLRRYFKRMVQLAKTQKKFAVINWAFNKQAKLFLFGVGLLRGALRKRSMRLALFTWCETASLMMAWELADNHFQARLRKRVFGDLKDTLRTLVAAKSVGDEAATRAAGIVEAIEEAAREKNMLTDAAEAAAKRRKAQTKATLMRERAAEHRARIEEARARSRARDTEVMVRQQEARRRRVYEDRARMTRDFEDEWNIKFNDIVKREMEATLRTGMEAPFRVQKEVKILKRKFFVAPTPETAELERALQDPANVIFAHMANLLFKENKSLHAFFQQFDREDNGYLGHEEFKRMVSSLNIKLSGEQIRAVIRSIDLDGGGYIDFQEFEAAVKRHEDVCGVAGSPWKMYISPVHVIMVLHNVETNEKIWDYKATDQDLERVVSDSIVELEGIAAKKKATEERMEAWKNLLKDRAATTLQRHYHVWAARKKRSVLSWKRDLEKAREKYRSDSNACTKIQCWWRKLRAKWLALRLLQITVEVLFDPGSNRPYYFNHGLGLAFWELPRILRRWHGHDARMPELPEWVFIARTSGEFYFNTRSYLRQEDKPPGYLRCLSCKTQLATRRCIIERQDLCFVCYRLEHLQWEDGCWHDWEPSRVQTCGVCIQSDAAKVCLDCKSRTISGGWLHLCDCCWATSHVHPDMRHHRGISVEEWEAWRRGSTNHGDKRYVHHQRGQQRGLGNDGNGGNPDHNYGAETFGYVF